MVKKNKSNAPKTPGVIHNVTINNPSYLKRMGRRKPVSFQFLPAGVNVLAGPNGCGKSSLIEAMLNSNTKALRKTNGVEMKTTKGAYFFFDFEKENPRTKSVQLQPDSLFGFALGAHLGLAGSHGQVILMIAEELQKHPGETMFIMDEPDQALDFDAIEALILMMNVATDTGSQVIIAAHHPSILLHPKFHVIEMKKGYLTTMRVQLQNLLSD